eukprot:916531-Prymnesium_polylepis.1
MSYAAPPPLDAMFARPCSRCGVVYGGRVARRGLVCVSVRSAMCHRTTVSCVCGVVHTAVRYTAVRS